MLNSHIGWGGLGRFTICLAEGLRRRGFYVAGIVTHSQDGNCEEYRDKLDSFSFSNNRNKVFLHYQFFEFGMVSVATRKPEQLTSLDASADC